VPTIQTVKGPMLVIDPDQNIINGMSSIMRYMGIKAFNTFYKWVELYGFPAIKTPEGKWLSSMTAIDQWIFLCAEVDWENRRYSRGRTRRVETMIRKLMDRNRQEVGQRTYLVNKNAALEMLENEIAREEATDLQIIEAPSDEAAMKRDM
jgi:hypothetical protein